MGVSIHGGTEKGMVSIGKSYLNWITMEKQSICRCFACQIKQEHFLIDVELPNGIDHRP